MQPNSHTRDTSQLPSTKKTRPPASRPKQLPRGKQGPPMHPGSTLEQTGSPRQTSLFHASFKPHPTFALLPDDTGGCQNVTGDSAIVKCRTLTSKLLQNSQLVILESVLQAWEMGFVQHVSVNSTSSVAVPHVDGGHNHAITLPPSQFPNTTGSAWLAAARNNRWCTFPFIKQLSASCTFCTSVPIGVPRLSWLGLTQSHARRSKQGTSR